MRTRSFRRHNAISKMWRRLRDDQNQHYRDKGCPCWCPGKAMARFKEQPKQCSLACCGNRRQYEGPSLQELRAGSPSRALCESG